MPNTNLRLWNTPNRELVSEMVVVGDVLVVCNADISQKLICTFLMGLREHIVVQ